LILLSCCRFGEATHPGPSEETFVIGCANANNLLSKADIIQKLPKGIWGFSETCLTSGGIDHLQKTLKCSNPGAPWKFVAGAPAPYTSTNAASIGGKHVGVGFCSQFPCRALNHDWTSDQWLSGRIQSAAFFAGQWIRGAITYGYAKDSHTPKVIESTCDLLQAVTKRITLQSHGPRFLLGDFNLEEHQIDLAELWNDYGFVEAQTFAHHMWGQIPTNTCHHKTRKDHLWLSREILPFVRKVVVDDTWFSDHALVYAEIAPMGPMEPIPVWRKPLDLPWDKVETNFQPEALALDPSKPETFLGEFWQQTERQIDAHLRQGGQQGLTQAHLGRAATHEVAWKKQEIPPLKRPRKSDFQEQFIGEHWQHYHWTRQLRRLQSYCQLVFPKPGKTINFDRQMALWRSILCSQGFTRGFRKFWPDRPVKMAGAPAAIPRWPPSHHDASLIFEGFKTVFMDFEAALIKSRRASAKLARLKDPHKIYQDTAKPQAMPVHTLLTTKATEVMETTEEGRVTTLQGNWIPMNLSKGRTAPSPLPTTAWGKCCLTQTL